MASSSAIQQVHSGEVGGPAVAGLSGSLNVLPSQGTSRQGCRRPAGWRESGGGKQREGRQEDISGGAL